MYGRYDYILFYWRDTRAAAPASASRLLSYCQNPGAPPPQPTGRGTNTRSLWRPRPPMVAMAIDNPNH